jgi:VIT1/CCC1 family predicted Fe2+/Mn2+ transporter
MIQFVRRYLDPSERMSEVLFGVIMTLTFTLGAGIVVKEGPHATRDLLIGVVGCNIAWGVIDGLLFIFGAMFTRGYRYRVSRVLAKEGRATAEVKLCEYLHNVYGEAISESTRKIFCRDVIEHVSMKNPAPVAMTREDVFGAVANFLLVALTSVPAVLPFLIFQRHMLALRISNLLLIIIIFFVGWKWADHINANRWRIGLGMAVGGLLLVQFTILLGG